MVLVLQIALGIILAIFLLRYLDVIIRYSFLIVASAIAIALIFYVSAFLVDHKTDAIDVGKGILFIVASIFGATIFALLLGLISERLPTLRKLTSTELIPFQHMLVESENNKHSNIYLDFLEQRIRLGFLTVLVMGVVWLVGAMITRLAVNIESMEYGGYASVAFAYVIFFLLRNRASQSYEMSDSEIKENIKKRQKLGYDTSDLEEMLKHERTIDDAARK